MSKSISKFVAAAVIYAGFAVYLYQPYFKIFHKLQFLILASVCLGSLGCFVLSRRWVIGFAASLFAGAIYGFGPFLLGLARFHPTAGLLAAGIPWLFCLAAFGPRARWQWLGIPLSALPFLAIVLFFQVTTHYRLFAVPIQAKLHLADLAGLLAPLVPAKTRMAIIGFYHAPIAPLMMGFSMLLAARRFGILVIFGIGAVLAFSGCLFNISPIIWLAIPVLCCSILIGEGMQGLILASWADRKWLLTVTLSMAALSVVMLLPAVVFDLQFVLFNLRFSIGNWKVEKLLTETAKMYILGAVAVAIIFFMARAKLRIRWLRWIILCSAMAIDIFLGARLIVDRTF